MSRFRCPLTTIALLLVFAVPCLAQRQTYRGFLPLPNQGPTPYQRVVAPTICSTGVCPVPTKAMPAAHVATCSCVTCEAIRKTPGVHDGQCACATCRRPVIDDECQRCHLAPDACTQCTSKHGVCSCSKTGAPISQSCDRCHLPTGVCTHCDGTHRICSCPVYGARPSAQSPACATCPATAVGCGLCDPCRCGGVCPCAFPNQCQARPVAYQPVYRHYAVPRRCGFLRRLFGRCR